MLYQIVNEILRINAEEERRELGVYHLPTHRHSGVRVSHLPILHKFPGTIKECFQLPC